MVNNFTLYQESELLSQIIKEKNKKQKQKQTHMLMEIQLLPQTWWLVLNR